MRFLLHNYWDLTNTWKKKTLGELNYSQNMSVSRLRESETRTVKTDFWKVAPLLGSVRDQTSPKRTSFQLTFLHDTPPPLGPVTQLHSVALFYLCPLLEAANQLTTQPVTIVDPLHGTFVVPRLTQEQKTHTLSEETEIRLYLFGE